LVITIIKKCKCKSECSVLVRNINDLITVK
jgi:hypothetical protein